MINKVLVFAALLIVVGGVVAQIISRKDNDRPLVITAEAEQDSGLSARKMPVKVVFQNTSDQTIRLLNIFDLVEERKMFFMVRITDMEGTPVDTIGGGKISLSKNAVKYLELGKNERMTVSLDLTDFLPAGKPLKSGTYNVSITYQNQYGENCFKGKVESRPISLNISD
jgi:hypothetical protein